MFHHIRPILGITSQITFLSRYHVSCWIYLQVQSHFFLNTWLIFCVRQTKAHKWNTICMTKLNLCNIQKNAKIVNFFTSCSSCKPKAAVAWAIWAHPSSDVDVCHQNKHRFDTFCAQMRTQTRSPQITRHKQGDKDEKTSFLRADYEALIMATNTSGKIGLMMLWM